MRDAFGVEASVYSGLIRKLANPLKLSPPENRNHITVGHRDSEMPAPCRPVSSRERVRPTLARPSWQGKNGFLVSRTQIARARTPTPTMFQARCELEGPLGGVFSPAKRRSNDVMPGHPRHYEPPIAIPGWNLTQVLPRKPGKKKKKLKSVPGEQEGVSLF